MRSRYPFEALLWLREKRVDHAAAEVAERARDTARARQAESRAHAARVRVEQDIAAVAQAEQARLAAGSTRVDELRVAADYRRGAAAALALEQEREHRSQELVRAQAAAEAGARRTLGTVSAESELIDAHHSQFRSTQRAAEDRVDEEAAEEQWAAKNYPVRRA